MPKKTDTQTVNFSVRLPVAVNDQLQAAADEFRRSRNQAVVLILERVLADDELRRRCFSVAE
jgi:predicted transcriptional regulator